MRGQIPDIANRFIAGEACSASELASFKSWLTDTSSQSEVELWLAENWSVAEEIESGVLIESVYRQIEAYESSHRRKPVKSITRILRFYQKTAAILLVPLIAACILYLANNKPVTSDKFTETYAPRGQKSQITLVDGTKVWLNSDTKIKYPGTFSGQQREVSLEGEAFFEVTKDAHHPFVVHTSKLDVKVLGTKFNVKAYNDENQIETSLFEGKVNLVFPATDANSEPVEKALVPNHALIFYKSENKLKQGKFLHDEIDGWKNNRLIFKDDTFSNLVRKVERWYDVKVVYDAKLFNDRRLTVELHEGERLERLMEIIGVALSVEYKYEKGQIILTPKAKNM